MPVVQLGTVNVNALNVPQPLIQIVPPQFLFAGVPSNIVGHVGTASWGPVGLAQPFGSYASYAQIFGPTINRTYDMGGQVYLACAQGANAHYGVRVTDGTDVAATASVGLMCGTGTITFSAAPAANDTLVINGTTVTFVASATTSVQITILGTAALQAANLAAYINASTDANISLLYATVSGAVVTVYARIGGTAGNSYTLTKTSTAIAVSGATLTGGSSTTFGLTVTAKYTGSLGNSTSVAVQAGTQSGTWKVVVSNPNLSTEVFDNIGSGLSGAALWTAIAYAINNGSGVRGASNIIIASVGSSTQQPVPSSTTISGGTDGVTSITTSVLLGQDTIPRKGMYALRGTKFALFGIADLSDSTALGTILAFAMSANAYGIWSSPSGDTITNASTTLANAGIDNFTIKALFGDWIVWQDTINGIPQRLSAPTGVALGRLGALSPQISGLNKQIAGIVGTQSSVLGKKYEYSDFSALATARMDVITNQSPGGSYFSMRLGINTSSNPIIIDDSYPRNIYYLAKSIEVIAGQYIGANQTITERRQARTSLMQFLQLQQDVGIIYEPDGSQAYQVVLDTTNNTPTSAALGYQNAYVKAAFGAIVRYFVINLEGGASVTISTTPPNS